MDFANFAAVEFVGAIEAQRDYERSQRKWLLRWREMRRAAADRARSAPIVIADETKAA